MQLTGTNHPSGLILFEVACFQVTAFGSVDELRLKKGWILRVDVRERAMALVSEDCRLTIVVCQVKKGPLTSETQQAFAGAKAVQTTRDPALMEQGRPLVARARWNHPVPFRTRK